MAPCALEAMLATGKKRSSYSWWSSFVVYMPLHTRSKHVTHSEAKFANQGALGGLESLNRQVEATGVHSNSSSLSSQHSQASSHRGNLRNAARIRSLDEGHNQKVPFLTTCSVGHFNLLSSLSGIVPP